MKTNNNQGNKPSYLKEVQNENIKKQKNNHYFEEADGGYIEGGWYIANTNFEIDLRYDTYTHGENHPTSAANDESRTDTWTIGTQYHFNKKTRINLEYANRDFESETAAVEAQQKDVAGRYAVQLTHTILKNSLR